MKTSQEWWNETKADQVKLQDWLKKQFHGETTAAKRITSLLGQFVNQDSTEMAKLKSIAADEAKHAEWIAQLLIVRDLKPETLPDHAERYWNETLPSVKDFITGSAVAARAEAMRLERIEVIANDESAPADIRETFQNILKDEVMHATMFREMCGEEAFAKAGQADEQGRNALGLQI